MFTVLQPTIVRQAGQKDLNQNFHFATLAKSDYTPNRIGSRKMSPGDAVDSVALEATPGPWLERARTAGCRAIHAPFLEDRCEFSQDALEAALQGMPEKGRPYLHRFAGGDAVTAVAS